MLKLKAQNNVVLGLTEENVKRLKSGEPIRIKGEDLDLGEITLYIVYGETADIISQSFLGQSAAEALSAFHQKKDTNAS